jgi:outer membrane protein TolC
MMDLKDYAPLFLGFSLLFCSSAYAQNGSDELLSALKSDSFKLRDESARAQKFLDKYDWLFSTNLSYTDKKNETPNYRTKTFLVSIEQPVFKSGGILSKVWYADASFEAARLGIASDRNDALREVLELAYKIQRTAIALKKDEFSLENAKIDIDRKKAHYLAGLLDGSFLDNAIVAKNAIENTLVDRQKELKILQNRFAAISDRDPMGVELPIFSVIEEDKYLANSTAAKKAALEAEAAKHKKRITISEYLPQVSLFANYTDQKQTSQNALYESSGSSYAYGFKISMSIDPKSYKSHERTRVEELIAQNSAAQKRRDAKSEYKDAISKIENIDKKIDIALSDAKSYDSLYEQTLALYRAGLKTDDDVSVMRNSKNARELEAKALQMDKQIEILTLYFKANN